MALTDYQASLLDSPGTTLPGDTGAEPQSYTYSPGPDGGMGGYYPTSGGTDPTYSSADLSSFNTQKQNIYGSANDWAKNYGIGLGGSITDYINNLKQGQQAIDERGIQNDLALRQGRTGVLGMVSRGIRSGGVMLANRNASDSSASAALANAYGEIGRGQLSNVGNQYALENRNIGLQQGNFDVQAQAGARKIQDTETQDIGGAVSQARDKLAALDAWAADKSLPERIQVEQEKAAIQAQIQDALDKYNTQLSGWKNVNPMSAEARRGKAASLAQAGQVAANPFDFQSQTPLRVQNSPFSSNLPLFLSPSKKKE